MTTVWWVPGVATRPMGLLFSALVYQAFKQLLFCHSNSNAKFIFEFWFYQCLLVKICISAEPLSTLPCSSDLSQVSILEGSTWENSGVLPNSGPSEPVLIEESFKQNYLLEKKNIARFLLEIYYCFWNHMWNCIYVPTDYYFSDDSLCVQRRQGSRQAGRTSGCWPLLFACTTTSMGMAGLVWGSPSPQFPGFVVATANPGWWF